MASTGDILGQQQHTTKTVTMTRSAERMAARILMRVKSSLILVFSASIRPARPPSSCPASPDTSFCLMASTSTTLVAGYLAVPAIVRFVMHFSFHVT